jgi:type IV pilus assembly protein PilZ
VQTQRPPIGPRVEPRAPIELKVEYKRINSFFADYTRNISKGGTFIKTTKPLAIGTTSSSNFRFRSSRSLSSYTAKFNG